MAKNYTINVNKRVSQDLIALRSQVNLFEELAPIGSSVLDVGCGTGALSLELSKRGFAVTGVDISPSMLKQLAKKAKGKKIEVVRADIFQLEILERKFTSAISRWVLPHFDNWTEILSSVHSVLEPGGVFVFDFPSRDHVLRADKHLTKGVERKLKFDHFRPLTEVDPFFFYGAETDEQIIKKLASSGFLFVKRVPYGLLLSNLLLFGDLDSQQLSRRERYIGAAIKFVPQIRILLEELERNITPFVHPSLVHGSFVVARKV